jgi:(R,R)-butanediol dehydrogenase / meso-butanediol dehydrogenase / diacetyl reductase
VQAVVLTAQPPRLETVEVDDPTPAPGQVVVRVTACGICGSDLHTAAVLGSPGTILGHEIAGVIDDVGPGVDERWVQGTAVTARPFASCGTCRYCLAGRADHCASFELLGFTRPGGFAERVALSADELYSLPASVTGPEQALVEPLAVARHGVRRAGLRAGEAVAVLGAGPIGLATTAWARTLGASTVVVSDPVATRRALAEKLGADATVDPTAQDVSRACEEAVGSRPPVVIECTGKAGLLEQGLQLADVDGRVAVVGVCMAPDTIFPWNGLHKEIDVRFALYYDRQDFVDTLRALDDGTLQIDGLITEEVGLTELPATFAALLENADTGKVVVTP